MQVVKNGARLKTCVVELELIEDTACLSRFVDLNVNVVGDAVRDVLDPRAVVARPKDGENDA